MKKFNEFESDLIQNALDYYAAHLEAEVEAMQKKTEGTGLRPIIAPGFYNLQVKDLKFKVTELTKKRNNRDGCPYTKIIKK